MHIAWLIIGIALLVTSAFIGGLLFGARGARREVGGDRVVVVQRGELDSLADRMEAGDDQDGVVRWVRALAHRRD